MASMALAWVISPATNRRPTSLRPWGWDSSAMTFCLVSLSTSDMWIWQPFPACPAHGLVMKVAR